METQKNFRENLRQPAFFEISDVNVQGRPAKRIFCILKTTGCNRAKKSPCIMCNFNAKASENIEPQDIIEQAKKLFENPEIKNVQELHISPIGSFFDDKEMPSGARKYILEQCAGLQNLLKISVETRINYLTPEKVSEAKSLLRRNQEFEIAVGYETHTEEIREGILNKRIYKEGVNYCLKICKNAGVSFKAFILIKPPPLNDEEAEAEAEKAAIFILKKCKAYNIPAKIALQPLFITGPVLTKLHSEKDFQPPNLWTVIETIKKYTAPETEKNAKV